MLYLIRKMFSRQGDLLKIRDTGKIDCYGDKIYEIIDVLEHNDKRVYYTKSPVRDIFLWNIKTRAGVFIHSIHLDELELNSEDQLFEMEDDDSARLYFEVN